MARLNQRLVVVANGILREHLQQAPDGIWDYEQGWNDERVAEIVGHGLNRSQIAHLRSNLFGPVRRMVSPVDKSVVDILSMLDEVNEKLDLLLTHYLPAEARGRNAPGAHLSASSSPVSGPALEAPAGAAGEPSSEGALPLRRPQR